MKNLFKMKIFFLIAFSVISIGCSLFYFKMAITTKEVKIDRYEVLSYNKSTDEDVLYLSDIPYQKAQIGWGTIGLDKTNSNTALAMNIDGTAVIVKKGIWAHATSTVEYDISNYANDYDYFTTYYGLNTTAGGNGNGVKFYIYTSEDGKNWTLRTEENPTPLKATNPAKHVKIDIRNVKYIRLYAHDNGSNASDHAVWGDAKLVKEDYSDDVMKPVSEFDEIIKNTYKSGPVEGDLKLVLLQRTFIKRVGQYQLRSFLENDPKNYETLDWFLNNEEAIRLWTIGGRPNGTYERSLQVLSDLYHTYKEDLSNENETALGTRYKDLYLKMILSLSLTHSSNVVLWIDGRQSSNAIVRYQIYKDMHLNNQLDTSMFENYTIDEMRGVMNTNIDDEEILWLHDYSKKFSTTADRFNPYKYINYTLGYSYYRPQYYTQANYAKWDQKYNLSKYNITYQSGKPKLWIVFEEGAVCGGLSKTAANLYGVWGYPARVVGQPGHAAYVYLYNAGGGKFAWQLANSVVSTGWANTTGNGINGWGTKYATNWGGIQSGSYLLLSQDAQNEYEKYEKAEMLMLLADVYKSDRKKLEQIYRDALEEEIINLTAWIGLVDLYISDSTKSEEDLLGLAEEIANVYTYHPLPMYDLTRIIGSKVTSAAYRSKLMRLQDETLRKATKATSKDTLYTKEVPVIANAILGVVDSKVASFSFDGANAGKIVLSKQLQSAQVSWKYSLDKGATWKDCFEHSAQLSKEELDSITADNDIKIHITGLPMTDANIYTIEINKGVFPSGTVSIDDLENKVNGVTDKMEWTLDPNGEWNSFADTNPTFRGDVRVYIRMLATGTNTMSDPVYYTFTTNVSSDTNRYIPRGNLKVISVSGTGGGNKDNILDGDFNTYWYGPMYNLMTGQKYKDSYAIIELDKPRYVSELDYSAYAKATSLGNYPAGKAKTLEIYVSMDGTNWELAATKTNLANDNTVKKITFDDAYQAKYVKINCPAVWEQGLQLFVSIAVINLYENPSASEVPTAEINYNIVNKTNKNVVAELVDENRPITITNNDGKTTHTFTENGEFTFEFVDRNGHKGSALAKVDWIDKTAPNASISFSTTEVTNENVVATITFDKPNVTILSTDVELATNPVDGSKTITFLENNDVELKFQDELGNIGTKTISVDWIDLEAPTAEFEFNTTHLTDGEVIATLVPSEEVTITNNNASNTYTFTKNGSFTFEFVDHAGNRGSATANVNWISKLPEYKLTYSNTELTNRPVDVLLEIEDGYRIFNNNAQPKYTFTDSGTFNFQYKDPNGYDGIIPVTVDWIDLIAPTAEFTYSISSATNQNVVATLVPSEEITITNNNGEYTYTFTDNGEFTFDFVDRVGNKGVATAKVDWIDRIAPTATIKYSTTESTYDPVTATLVPNEEVTILGNGSNTYTFKENAEYTFEFMDKAGNKGYATAHVDWIKKRPEENNNPKPDNKPTTPSTTNEPNKPNNEGNNDSPNIKDDTYKDFSSGNVNIKIPDSIIDKYGDVSLDYEKQQPTEAQKNRYGEDSEVYEISLETKDKQKIDLSSETIEQSIKLNANKTFDAVYIVRYDGSVVRLTSQLNGNVVTFKTNGLGKFIIAYKSDKKDNENQSTTSKVEENEGEQEKTNYLPFIIIGTIVVIIIGFGAFAIKKINN